MPRLQEYSRRRFYVMQGVMWLLLAGALGIAALTSRTLRAGGSARVSLGDPVDLETVSVRVPATWRVREDGTGQIFVLEPVRMPLGRMLTIVEEGPDDSIIGRFFGTSNRTAPQPRPSRGEISIPMGPMTGVLSIVKQRIPIDADDGVAVDPKENEIQQVQIRGIGLLPSSNHRVTVILHALSADDEVNPADVKLVKQVANSIAPLKEPSKEDRPQLTPLQKKPSRGDGDE